MLLPALLAYRLFPEFAPGAKAIVTGARMTRIAPMVIVLGLVQIFGQLAIIAVATDGGRSTVGGAIRRAFLVLPRVIVSIIILTVAAFVLIVLVSIVLGIIAAMFVGARAAGDARLAAMIAIPVMVPLFWAAVRISLFTTVAVTDEAGPWSSVRTSWRLTRGHAPAIATSYILAVLGALGLQGLIGLVAGGAGRAIDAMLGGHFAQFAALVIAGATGAVVNLYLTMLVITIWRRLRA